MPRREWHIRPARPAEASRLSELAIAAKSTWGYDAAFLAAVRSELVVGADDVRDHPCYVAEQDGRIVGFYLIVGDSLERLFVAPDRLRRGIGRALFRHLVANCRRPVIRIVSDPFAGPFYERMGARKAGDAPSPAIAGRALPVYEYATGRRPHGGRGKDPRDDRSGKLSRD